MFVVCTDTFFAQVGPQHGNFLEVFAKKFQNYWIKFKVINIFESPNIFHWKPAKRNKMGVVWGQNFGQARSKIVKKSKEIGIINRFFSYFAQGIHFKARSSGCTNT